MESGTVYIIHVTHVSYSLCLVSERLSSLHCIFIKTHVVESCGIRIHTQTSTPEIINKQRHIAHVFL